MFTWLYDCSIDSIYDISFIIGGITGICTLLYILAKRYRVDNSTRIKNVTPVHYNENHGIHRDRDIERDSFSKDKLSGDDEYVYDYIVVGSGISGLLSAGLLARTGKKVLVLESHDRAGGCMHYFEDKGFVFDTGIHYLGEFFKLKKKLDLLTHPELPIELEKMGNEANDYTYDRIYYANGKIFDYKAGKLKESLLKKFPNEKAGIEAYFGYINNNDIINKLWGISIAFPMNNIFGTLYMKLHEWLFPDRYLSAGQLLDKLFTSTKIKQVLCGNFSDSGGYPSEVNMRNLLGVHKHYDKNGGFYPIDGCTTLIKPMIPVIERTGGRVLVNAQVTRFIIDNNTICRGVAVAKSRSTGNANEILIYAKEGVISSAGYYQTKKLVDASANNSKLIDFPALPSNFTAKMQCQHFYIFLGFRGSQEELQLPSYNEWILEGQGKDESYEAFVKSLHSDFFQKDRAIGFIGFPSAKDPRFNSSYPNKSTCMLLTEVTWEMFEEYKQSKHGNRSHDYNDFCAQIRDHILTTIFYPRYPQLKDRIEYMETGSPLTTNHYLNKIKGESYGISYCSDRIRYAYKYLSPRTPIENLYLTGQDCVCGGYAGAFCAAELTVNIILGYLSSPYNMLLQACAPISAPEGDIWSDIKKAGKLTKDDFAIHYKFQKY